MSDRRTRHLYVVVSVSRSRTEGETFCVEGFSLTTQGASHLLKKFWETKGDSCLRAYVTYCSMDALDALSAMSDKEKHAVDRMPSFGPICLTHTIRPKDKYEVFERSLREILERPLREAGTARLSAKVSISVEFSPPNDN